MTRAYIVAAVLLASSSGWAEGVAIPPATQEAAVGEATGASLERRAFLASVDWVHAPLVLEAAEEWDLSPFLLLALLWAESRLDCTAVNKRSRAGGCGQWTRTGIAGLNRIRRARGDDRVFTRALAFDPREGIGATAEYLAHLVERWGPWRGTMFYNGNKWKRAFARKVFRRVDYYRAASGLPPMREDEMRKKRQQQPGMTSQGVRDLSHLAGRPPTPGPKMREEFEATCHKCGRDVERCDCWSGRKLAEPVLLREEG